MGNALGCSLEIFAAIESFQELLILRVDLRVHGGNLHSRNTRQGGCEAGDSMLWLETAIV